jgi:hypothetical protein
MQDRAGRGGVQVIERRDPPRIGSGDLRPELMAPDAIDRTVVAGGKWRKPFRHFGYRRTILAIAALCIGLTGLIYLGSLGQRAALGWLAAQPDYQVRFRDIRLVPGPPKWYRGTTEEFLESIRRSAGETEMLPLLNPEKQRVKFSFERSPWIEQVDRVVYLPRGIRVELRYRTPVALVEISRSHSVYVLDENARILPLEDVDHGELLRLGALIWISGEGLLEPSDTRPGQLWKPGPGIHDLTDGNHRIPDAASLASFLVRKNQSLGPSHSPALEIRWIVPMDKEHRGLFLWDAERHYPILWGNMTDEEPISAEERWEMLLAWSLGNPKWTDPKKGYWVFTKKGLLFRAIRSMDSG